MLAEENKDERINKWITKISNETKSSLKRATKLAKHCLGQKKREKTNNKNMK